MTTAQTKSRQAILDRLTGREIEGPGLPVTDASQLTRFEDPVGKFVEMLKFVGGESHFIDRPEQVNEILSTIEVFANAKQIVSLIPEAVSGNVDLSTVEDPHELAALDWMIAKGEFIVAENGAIWIDGASMRHRVLLFIAQYLAIVVSRSEVVHHLHEGYARIGIPTSPFGVYVSGPSKTADIEQSLVLGAHGCRTLQVFLLP